MLKFGNIQRRTVMRYYLSAGFCLQLLAGCAEPRVIVKKVIVAPCIHNAGRTVRASTMPPASL